MSAQIMRVSEEQYALREYKAEWKTSKIIALGTKSLQTTVFYPLPNVELGFCFEIGYQEMMEFSYSSDTHSSFKLALKKIICLDISEALKMEIKVIAHHYDGTILKDYDPIPAVIVKEMSSFCFQDYIFISKCTNHNQRTHRNILGKGDGVIKIKCCLRFFDYPSVDRSMESRGNLDDFAKDFLSLYNPCVLSDIQFNVAHKTLNAHKSVLAAHSPVFLKMFAQTSESNTHSVIISDITHESFEMFLKYFYSSEIEDKSLPALQELFALAEKYDVRTLKREVLETAVAKLSVENVLDIFDIVNKSDERKFIETTKKFAAKHIDELLLEEKWNDFVQCQPLIACEVVTAAYKISKETSNVKISSDVSEDKPK